jgi:hypothetical protein
MRKTRVDGKPSQAHAKTIITDPRLDELIDEATVDCYNESNQLSGIFSTPEEHLETPFTTHLLGVEAVVERVELADENEIAAACRRGSNRQRISILDLPLPHHGPAGAEWIEACRSWARWR